MHSPLTRILFKLQSGEGDSQDGGGGSGSILTLITGLLGSSSGVSIVQYRCLH